MWAFITEPTLARNDLPSCLHEWQDPTDKSLFRYGLRVSPEDFYDQLFKSPCNPWRNHIPSQHVVFPLIIKADHVAQAYNTSVVSWDNDHDNNNKTDAYTLQCRCPMQRVIGSFSTTDHSLGGAIFQDMSDLTFLLRDTSPTLKRLVIYPNHDTVEPILDGVIRVTHNDFLQHANVFMTSTWDEVVLDRIPLSQLEFPNTSLLWIISSTPIQDMIHDLIRLYRIQFDPQLGLEHLIHAINRFKCIGKTLSCVVCVCHLSYPTDRCETQVAYILSSQVYASITNLDAKRAI